MIRCLLTMLCLFYSQTALAQVNLLQGLDMESATIQGDWNLADGNLAYTGKSDRGRLKLLSVTSTRYKLSVEFTRNTGTDSIGFILPVGESQCNFNLAAFRGEGHGIGLIDGKMAKDNETTIKPGTLENGKKYRLTIDVRSNGEAASINSELDGQPFLQWSGKTSSLSMFSAWELTGKKDLGLFVSANSCTFHKIEFTEISTKPAMVPAPVAATSKTIQFERKKWIVSLADSVKVEDFKGSKALHVQGQEQAYVPIVDSKFKSGTIEVDIASATFSGIGFRGQNNGTLVEKVYFRPFNSGTAKHDKTVQYSMLGRPQEGWRALRENFPGKYEAGADIKVNEWFHVKVEVTEDACQVFIDEEKKPVLIVDDLLGDGQPGSIGVWSWNGYFKNFSAKEN